MQPGSVSKTDKEIQKITILVVEDDHIVGLGIQSQLKDMGYEVPCVVATGANAIASAGQIQPDIVIMDISLEGKMNGIEAAAQIKKHYGIPVIFLSAHSDENTLVQAAETEPFAYLTKPFDDKTLKISIQMALYKNAMQCRLNESEETLRKVNRKLAIISSITRDNINDQLTILMGFLYILEQQQPAPSLREFFRKANTAAQRISEMIRYSNEYEKIGVEAPQWYDTHKLVMLAAKQAPLGQIEVKTNPPAGVEVFADPLIVKVFYNLIDNAVRYGRKITTIRFFVQESGEELVLVCEDDGDGVPADVKEKIFDRGFGKNIGLGLFLSREILSITGITIRESSEPGKGARFEMTVPKGAWRITQSERKGE